MPRTADKRIVALEEPKLTLDLAADPDSRAAFDPANGANRGGEPERTATAKVDAVVTLVDIQRRGEPPRPARDVEETVDAAAKLHQFDTFERLQRPQQYACTDPCAFAADVERVPTAVDEVDVGVPAFQKQRAIARCLTAKRMARRIALDVGLGFDDAAAHPASRMSVHQCFADQEPRQAGSIGRQIGAAQAMRRSLHGRR